MKQVRPKKNLGQHFLTDLNIAKRIADTVDACPDIPVLEIGPGMGVLTQFLVEKPRQVKAVEIDDESVRYLNEKFPKLRDNIIGDDFFKMLDNKELIPCCTGMIQREVALRIASKPGSRQYGILSVMIQAWYDTEYLFTVDEDVFNPPPKVKRVVKTVFNQRRKMLRVSLKPLFNKETMPSPEFFANDMMTKRPEQLAVADFVELTNRVASVMGK